MILLRVVNVFTPSLKKSTNIVADRGSKYCKSCQTVGFPLSPSPRPGTNRSKDMAAFSKSGRRKTYAASYLGVAKKASGKKKIPKWWSIGGQINKQKHFINKTRAVMFALLLVVDSGAVAAASVVVGVSVGVVKGGHAKHVGMFHFCQGSRSCMGWSWGRRWPQSLCQHLVIPTRIPQLRSPDGKKTMKILVTQNQLSQYDLETLQPILLHTVYWNLILDCGKWTVALQNCKNMGPLVGSILCDMNIQHVQSNFDMT